MAIKLSYWKAFTEARLQTPLGGGLNYRQMAVEFNKKKIRRKSGQPWTARYIRKRWATLNRLQRDRAQTGTASTEALEPFVLRRSA